MGGGGGWGRISQGMQVSSSCIATQKSSLIAEFGLVILTDAHNSDQI